MLYEIHSVGLEYDEKTSVEVTTPVTVYHCTHLINHHFFKTTPETK